MGFFNFWYHTRQRAYDHNGTPTPNLVPAPLSSTPDTTQIKVPDCCSDVCEEKSVSKNVKNDSGTFEKQQLFQRYKWPQYHQSYVQKEALHFGFQGVEHAEALYNETKEHFVMSRINSQVSVQAKGDPLPQKKNEQSDLINQECALVCVPMFNAFDQCVLDYNTLTKRQQGQVILRCHPHVEHVDYTESIPFQKSTQPDEPDMWYVDFQRCKGDIIVEATLSIPYTMSIFTAGDLLLWTSFAPIIKLPLPPSGGFPLYSIYRDKFIRLKVRSKEMPDPINVKYRMLAIYRLHHLLQKCLISFAHRYCSFVIDDGKVQEFEHPFKEFS